MSETTENTVRSQTTSLPAQTTRLPAQTTSLPATPLVTVNTQPANTVHRRSRRHSRLAVRLPLRLGAAQHAAGARQGALPWACTQ